MGLATLAWSMGDCIAMGANIDTAG
jgi:hypothetical protein